MGNFCSGKSKSKNREKTIPKIDIENNSKISPEINKKIAPDNNIKIFNDKKEGQNKIKDQKNKTQQSENKKKKSEETKNKFFEELPTVPLNLLFEVKKSICKIIINNEHGKLTGTGFFMKVNDSKKYLVTNHHVISNKITNDDISLNLTYKKNIRLHLTNHDIQYFQELDITLIEIKDTDEICKEIKFLTYDLNYILGYDIYKNGYVFTVGYPLGELYHAYGEIVDIKDYKFYHNISTEVGSSGSPIMLLNDNINEIRVIGIHSGGLRSEPLNFGTFIAEILGEEKEKFINPKKIKKIYI
jgi:V8-like Glu-specific endopeptidase